MPRWLRYGIRSVLLAAVALTTGMGCSGTAATTGEPPSVPASLAAAAQSSSSILLSWNPSTGADTYKVQRAPDAAGSAGTWGASTTVTSSPHADSGLSASTTYWYRVAATNAVGDSSFSSPVNATTPASGGGTAPAVPTNLAAAAQSSSSILVSWNAPAGATAYKVQRAPNAGGGAGTWGASTTVTSSPLTDSGLSASTTYWYRVAASNAVGDSSFSSPVNATTQAAGGGGAITTIPAALSALSTKRIFFAHASVGGNILTGIQAILDANGGTKPSIVSLVYPTPSPGSLATGRIGELAWGDALNKAPWEKVATFQSFMNGGGMGAVADVAMMKFCFIDFDAGPTSVETTQRAQELFTAYQTMVNAVQAANPGVKLVHFTAAITGALNGRREAYNNLVRSTYGGTGRVFDLADWESNGHTDSDGRVLDPAYAVAPDDAHLNSAGKAVVAQALLLFLANLP